MEEELVMGDPASMNYSLQQVMLRIKDPRISVKFYEDNFDMKCIHSYNFEKHKFSLYFLENSITANRSAERGEKHMWTMSGVCLELTHNHGTEKQPDFRVCNGNEAPYIGFSHITFECNDLSTLVQNLQLRGTHVTCYEDATKESCAFCLDPDGYSIKLIEAKQPMLPLIRNSLQIRFHHCMLRIRNAQESIYFYNSIFGMKVTYEKQMLGRTEYFLQTASRTKCESLFEPQNAQYLCLSHIHGTEKEMNFCYFNGNDRLPHFSDRENLTGYGHIGFLCDNLQESSNFMIDAGVAFKKKPNQGSMRNVAFVYDPDGYLIEIIQRGTSFAA